MGREDKERGERGPGDFDFSAVDAGDDPAEDRRNRKNERKRVRRTAVPLKAREGIHPRKGNDVEIRQGSNSSTPQCRAASNLAPEHSLRNGSTKCGMGDGIHRAQAYTRGEGKMSTLLESGISANLATSRLLPRK